MHVLKGQNDGIASLSWCPDDSLLLSCGREDSPEAIVFSVEVGSMVALSYEIYFLIMKAFR